MLKKNFYGVEQLQQINVKVPMMKMVKVFRLWISSLLVVKMLLVK